MRFEGGMLGRGSGGVERCRLERCTASKNALEKQIIIIEDCLTRHDTLQVVVEGLTKYLLRIFYFFYQLFFPGKMSIQNTNYCCCYLSVRHFLRQPLYTC